MAGIIRRVVLKNAINPNFYENLSLNPTMSPLTGLYIRSKFLQRKNLKSMDKRSKRIMGCKFAGCNFQGKVKEMYKHYSNHDKKLVGNSENDDDDDEPKNENEEQNDEAEDEVEMEMENDSQSQLKFNSIQGKMMDYQLAGLKWLIGLYRKGVNGILQDEMAKVGPHDTVYTQQATNSQPSLPAQIQAKIADVQALSDLNRALDKKVSVTVAQQFTWQHVVVEASMQNNKGKGRLKYLLQETEFFSQFAKGDQSTSLKKAKGRGHHSSKVTEEEDEECLKEEEDGLSGTGSTCLVTQPSCIQGKMRDYQLAGLKWILVDEMVCNDWTIDTEE